MIIKYFDECYTKKTENISGSIFGIINRIYALVIRISINIYLPIHYYYFIKIDKFITKDKREQHDEIILSLTTYRKRITKVHLTIQTLLRQTVKPSLIVLILSKDEFPDISYLPPKLIHLINYGLKIEFVEGNIKSHKKYYYTFKKYSDKKIILFDDDILYPEDLLSILIAHSNKYPNAVCSSRARIMSNCSYNEWKLIKEEQAPNDYLFATSGAGTLYPNNAINNKLLDIKLAINLTPNADDIWLHALTRTANAKITKTPYYSSLLQIIYFNNESLHSINIDKNQNDIQIKKVDEFISLKYKIKLFNKLK
jgi:hypothetical protein